MEATKYVTPDLGEIAMRLASHGSGAEVLDLLDALCYLDSCARNEYNADYFRVLMSTLARI